MNAQAELGLECKTHTWRVIDFDYKARVLVERCRRCGREQQRVAVGKPILDNADYYRKGKS